MERKEKPVIHGIDHVNGVDPIPSLLDVLTTAIRFDFVNVGDWFFLHTTGLVPPDNLYGQVFDADLGGFLFSSPGNFQADVAQAVFQVTGDFTVTGGTNIALGATAISIIGALPTSVGSSGVWWNDLGTVKISP